MLEQFGISEDALWWMFALSVVLFLASLVVVPILITRLPADYLLDRRPPPHTLAARHPALRVTILVLKNTLGVALIVAGALMLFLPGQGILAILMGVSLTNFPGKRRLELRILSSPPVERAINWMRSRAGKPPLQLPARHQSARSSRGK